MASVDQQVSIEQPGGPRARPRSPWHALYRNKFSLAGLIYLALIAVLCLAPLPWLLMPAPVDGFKSLPVGQRPTAAAYEDQNRLARQLPPSWWSASTEQEARLAAVSWDAHQRARADSEGVSLDEIVKQTGPTGTVPAGSDDHAPRFVLGTDVLGRDLATRLSVGGGISLAIGLSAATLSVFLGTMYGAIAGYLGGRVDGVMMRIVDILYGLPYVLLVVLLAVASDAVIDEYVSRSQARAIWVNGQVSEQLRVAGKPSDMASVRVTLKNDKVLSESMAKAAGAQPQLAPREVSPATRTTFDIVTLLVAIGGVSWLTMARVIRGQVMSLKAQPFVESARAVGASPVRIFMRHLLPNLTGPIIVYAALTVPQAILQESFLSFLGIGVKPPLPSWGNLAAEGLGEINTVQSNWWMLVFPCLALGTTLLALNFVGEGLREAFDPKSTNRR